MENVTVVLNPASGSTGDEFRGQLENTLRKYSLRFEIQETTPEISGEDLALRAVANGACHLIACGGDGTVMSVINGLGKSTNTGRLVLSIVPGGTANLLATALNIPMEIEKAVQVAAEGRDLSIDLGRCNDKLFALGLGLGLTERLVSRASSEEKERLGKLAYVKAMLLEVGKRPSSFSFRLDDGAEQQQVGVAVVVANAGQIGNNLHFAPNAKMEDGLLDLCLLHQFRLRDVARLLLRALLGRLQEDRAVSFHQARKIEIRSTPPLDLQIDGEVVDMKTPLIAEVLPGALTVRVPMEAIS